MLSEARRFYRKGLAEKLEHITQLAAASSSWRGLSRESLEVVVSRSGSLATPMVITSLKACCTGMSSSRTSALVDEQVEARGRVRAWWARTR